MTTSPFFSIVMPTKNRASFVEMGLYALSKQSFRDFEVILSDNSDEESDHIKRLIGQFQSCLFIKYVRSAERCSSLDNCEFAISFASGTYVLVNMNKMFLYPFALEYVYNFIAKENTVDMVTLTLDTLSSIDCASDSCTLSFNYNQKSNIKYSGKKVIKQFIDSYLPLPLISYSAQGLGNILYTFISREIICHIKGKYGRFFQPISGDYSSITMPLFYSRHSYKINIAMGVYTNNTQKSIGAAGARDFHAVMSYIQETDPMGLVTDYVFPEFVGSRNNAAVSEIIRDARKCKFIDDSYKINKNRLIINMYSDFMEQANVPEDVMLKIKKMYNELSWYTILVYKIQIMFRTKYSYTFLKEYVLVNTVGRVPGNFYSILRKHRQHACASIPLKNYYDVVDYADNYYREVSGLLSQDKNKC